jgi:hypothetical protein
MRRRIVSVAAVLALIAAAIVLVRFKSAPPQDPLSPPVPSDNGRISTEGNSAILDDEERALALLTDQERQVVENTADRDYRRVVLFGLAYRDEFSGDPSQLEVFLDAMRSFRMPDPDDPEAWESWQIVPTSLAFIARAWVQAGPYPSLEEECVRVAMRYGSESDELFRLQSAALLEVVRRHRPDRQLPAPAAAMLRDLRSDVWVETELQRQLDVLREAAAVAGRTLPE